VDGAGVAVGEEGCECSGGWKAQYNKRVPHSETSTLCEIMGAGCEKVLYYIGHGDLIHHVHHF
jgi:hypothetical protein